MKGENIVTDKLAIMALKTFSDYCEERICAECIFHKYGVETKCLDFLDAFDELLRRIDKEEQK